MCREWGVLDELRDHVGCSVLRIQKEDRENKRFSRGIVYVERRARGVSGSARI